MNAREISRCQRNVDPVDGAKAAKVVVNLFNVLTVGCSLPGTR